MNKKNKKYLLQLARRTIQKYLENKEILNIEAEDLDPSLKDKKGVFVTLWKKENKNLRNLRGCIGNLESKKPIYQNVIDNSIASALFDPRFPPVSSNELNDIKIEISILSKLKKIPDFNNYQKMTEYLENNKPGLFIKKGSCQATFLPQVWNELPDAESFLSHLCQKAGLESEEWKKMNLEMYQYTVEIFNEE